MKILASFLVRISYLFALIACVLSSAALSAHAAEQIRIVGSSTLYPFTSTVAERFARKTGNPAPIVESTGTGGGIKLFCRGDEDSPTITNASARMKQAQFQGCVDEGVTHIVEIKVGYDGIVLGESQANNFSSLTRREIFLALAARVPSADDESVLVDNPYTHWNQINPSLPNFRIEVIGPPPTSGTRTAFLELVMDAGANSFPTLKSLDKKQFRPIARKLREDGSYIEAGENDNLIIQKLLANPERLGIFGYSFLDTNRDRVASTDIDGVSPKFDHILSGKYPIARAMYIYVNGDKATPAVKAFLKEYTRASTWGVNGYLADKGLIPLGKDEAREYGRAARNLTPLKKTELAKN